MNTSNIRNPIDNSSNVPNTIKPKILIVDDQKNNLMAMKQTLDLLDIDISLAHSGNDALKLILDNDYALVLLDVQMPGMNGFETAELMRKIKAETPIVFITAVNRDQIHLFKGYDSAAIDFIFKPVDTDVLLSKVKFFLELFSQKNKHHLILRELEHINTKLHQDAPPTINAQQPLESLDSLEEKINIEIIPNILIVDDNSNNIVAIKSILEHLPIKLYEATSGNDALKFMLETDFALVLLDVQMPGLDGFETAELMRKSKYTKDVPIIFVTAISKEEQYVKRGLQIGAVDYLFKPLDPIILQSKISVFIQFYLHKKRMELLVKYLNNSQQMLSLKNEKLTQLAHTDSLTGLENRMNFEKLIAQTIVQSKNTHQFFALMFVDLDNFKHVNDTFGHDCGDLLLKEVAERLKTVIRHSDTVVIKNESISRLGGDEFAILIPNIFDIDAVEVIASRLNYILAQPFILQGHEANISASIGIAIYPTHGEKSEILVKNADIAMYKAKEAGKNGHQFYNESMQTTI